MAGTLGPFEKPLDQSPQVESCASDQYRQLGPLSQRFKQLWSRYQQSRDLISVGAYVPGGDPETDMAIARQAEMVSYLRQGLDESEDLARSSAHLAAVFAARQGG